MSNYFKIERDKEITPFSIYQGSKRNMLLQLSSVAGTKGRKAVRIDVGTISTIEGETGKAFIILDTHLEIKALIDALQTRLNGEVSTTSNKQLPSITNGKMIKHEEVIIQEIL